MASLTTAPTTVAPPAPKHFVTHLQDAGKSTSYGQMMIGGDWYGPGDTSLAMRCVSDALTSVGKALDFKAAPSGHVTPPSALEAARDGQAFLQKAYDIMEAEDFAPPVQARPFLSAAQGSFNTAIKEYSAKLEPTPKYR